MRGVALGVLCQALLFTRSELLWLVSSPLNRSMMINIAENSLGIIKALTLTRLLFEMIVVWCNAVRFWRYTCNPEDGETWLIMPWSRDRKLWWSSELFSCCELTYWLPLYSTSSGCSWRLWNVYLFHLLSISCVADWSNLARPLLSQGLSHSVELLSEEKPNQNLNRETVSSSWYTFWLCMAYKFRD